MEGGPGRERRKVETVPRYPDSVMLTDVDREILDLERTWWIVPGPKECAITERIGLDASSYYRRLSALIADEAALAYDPLTVRRLRRLVRPTPAAERT